MLIIIASWLYIVLIAYCLGSAFQTALNQKPGTFHFALTCITGLMVLTFICTCLCLFMPLGLRSNLLILLITACAAWLSRNQLRASFAADLSRLKEGNRIVSLIFPIYIFVFARLSYEPSSHFDDGLYYSTTIRWLEEFGTVKGLANVNTRIGFNSSWHILQANFSFRFLNLGLFNDMNGLIFLLMLLYSIGGMNDLLKGDSQWRTLLRAFIMLPIIAFHYTSTSDIMLFSVNFLSSPTPDIPVCLLIWLIFLLFLTRPKDTRNTTSTDILVVCYSAWACTIKFSSVPIFLLSCFILYRLAVERRIRQIASLGIGCFLIALPWIVRNVFLTGYLLFPFSAIDIFHVSWKLPLKAVLGNEWNIKAFALGAPLGRPYTVPVTTWFPHWVADLVFIKQVILGTVFIATLCYTFYSLVIFRRKGLAAFSAYRREIIAVITALAGILFWLVEAPDFRFGSGFLCIYCMLFLVLAFRFGLERQARYLLYPALIYLFVLAGIYYRNTWKRLDLCFAAPIPYRMPEQLYKVSPPNGGTFYLVKNGNSWNAPLPVANDYEYYYIHPVYIGPRIEDGFKPSRK